MILSAVTDLSSACHTHRTTYSFRHLPDDYPQHRFKLALVDQDDDFDVAWLYGCGFMKNLPQIMKWKRAGKKIVLGLDDNIWEFPEWRRDRMPEECQTVTEVLCEVADHLIASTPALVGPMGFPHKTTVAPNLIDVAAYNCPTPPDDDEVIRILWSGSHSHRGDLALIDSACCELIGKYGNKIEFTFVGDGPDNTLRLYWNKGVRYVPFQLLEHYWKTLRHFKPHIILSPMADCAFNRCKSSLRVLEAWSLNGALVYSPVGEYDATAADGVNGLKAESTEQWVEQVSRLVEDRSLRESLAAEGYKTVTEQWNWHSPTARLKWKPTVDRLAGLCGQ